MNHKVHYLTFGDQRDQRVITRTFGKIDNGTHTIFNMFEGQKGDRNREVNEEPQEFYYFFKLVPHEFVDYIDGVEKNSYSYSLSQNKKEVDMPELQTLTMIIDYAPVKMILSREWRKTGQFLIDCCSIIGGVFVIYGLINNFLLRTMEKCKSD